MSPSHTVILNLTIAHGVLVCPDEVLEHLVHILRQQCIKQDRVEWCVFIGSSSCRHLETLRLLALALGPLLQQFIADTRLYQDTSLFVDEGVAQVMISGEAEPMDDSDSCEADFLQYDLGTYEGAPAGWLEQSHIALWQSVAEQDSVPVPMLL